MSGGPTLPAVLPGCLVLAFQAKGKSSNPVQWCGDLLSAQDWPESAALRLGVVRRASEPRLSTLHRHCHGTFRPVPAHSEPITEGICMTPRKGGFQGKNRNP